MGRKAANLTLTEDDVATWKRRVKEGEEWVDELRKDSAPFREAFAAKFPLPFPDEEDTEQVCVSRIHRVVIQWVGSMYAQNPQIDLDPPWWTEKVNQMTVALQKAILNTEIRRVGLDRVMRKAIQTAFLDGWSWIKEGFHAEWEYEAHALVELTTDAEAENSGFEYVIDDPGMLPKAVLPHEDHAEHRERHNAKKQSAERKLVEYAKQIQEGNRIAQEQGTELPMDPIIQKELQRLQAMISAIEEHLAAHDKIEKERDRKGLAPTNEYIRSENCWLDNVHNSCVVWDKHATGTHDWRWVAELFIRPIHELRARFANEDITANYSDPKPGTRGDPGERTTGSAVHSETLERGGGGDDEDDPDALGAVWKVWDREHRRVIYIHDDMEKAVDVKDWPHKFLKNVPLRMLYFELDEDEFRPIPPAKHIWDQQQEINRYRTKASIVTRRNNRVAVAAAQVDPTDIERIAEGEDGTVVRLTSMGTKPRDAIAPIDWGPPPMDCHNAAAVADNDIQIDTGLTEAHLGGGIKARTATAADIEDKTSGVTLDIKLEAIQDVVVGLTGDLRSLMRQYYTEQRFVSLFHEGSKVMKSWTGSDLEDFEIRVSMGGSLAQDMNVARMQWMEFIKVASPWAQPLGIDMRSIFMHVAETMPGVGNPEELFISEAEQAPQMPQPEGAPGPGQGQNQTTLPGNRPGTGSGNVGQPARDLTKTGAG